MKSPLIQNVAVVLVSSGLVRSMVLITSLLPSTSLLKCSVTIVRRPGKHFLSIIRTKERRKMHSAPIWRKRKGIFRIG
jgi:hypothetical protein